MSPVPIAGYAHTDEIATYRSVTRCVDPTLRRAGSQSVRPIALIFGSPDCKAMKEDVLPRLQYFNWRSGEALDMFCMGYRVPKSKDFSPKNPKNFDQKLFQLAVMEFEEKSRWHYSGQTDFLLLNAFMHEEAGKKRVDLDFHTMFALTLEKAAQDRLIENARKFLEDVMQHARDESSKNLPSEMSDKVFLKSSGELLMEWFLSLFKLTPQKVKNLYGSCVRDYSRD
jgi:hypothetical protein